MSYDGSFRRLPVYLLVDSSESMVGEPMNALNQGLQQLCHDLKTDPMAIETAWVSVIAFASRARQVVPLTEVLQFNPPTIGVSPGTSLGAAFDLLESCVQKEVRKSSPERKGDWKPIVFLLTDGIPTDGWKTSVDRFKSRTSKGGVNMIAVACGEDADLEVLRSITPSVLVMKNATPGTFREFFKWVSASVSTVSVSLGREGQGVNLPGLPAGALEAAPKGGTTGEAKPASQIILAARCRDTRKGYLMRYRRAGTGYQAERAYPVGEDYFGESAVSAAGPAIDSGQLQGAPPCPYCKRPAWTLAEDGRNLVCSDTMAVGSKRAQVMFTLDITGSMSGELEGVKDSIKDFMDYVQAEGLAVEVGLIAFRDLEENEPPEVLRFSTGSFTSNAREFKSKLSRLSVDGGGGNPGESSFDAMVLASQQPFSHDVTRILIHITDEPPLLPDGEVRSPGDVVAALKRARLDQVHLVIPSHLQSDYEFLHDQFRGETFELESGGRGGNSFRRVLLDIGKSITVMARLG